MTPTLLNAAQYDSLSVDTYTWNLRKLVLAADASFKTRYVAAAYIITRDYGPVFLHQASASVKSLAEEMLARPEYDENSYDGSISYLATLN